MMAELRQRRAPVDRRDGGSSPSKAASAPANGGSSRPAAPDHARLLASITTLYVVLYLTVKAFGRVPEPLAASAPPDLFSEGRALAHNAHLTIDIGHRQVGTEGEEAAAQYLLGEVTKLAEQAAKDRPDLLVEAAREQVSGSVAMVAFKFDIANVYNNLTNIVLRIAPRAGADKKAVLVNSHYDSTLGTVGASDACSCVSVMLELARTIIASREVQLAAPVVFLINGGEETLSQAANGFMASSRFAGSLGAFINLESTGPLGPDVLFQNTGDWPLEAYARSAPYPRGTTMAQDFFELGLIPADTDYRMFSHRHYGNLPGIDIAFLFGGTAYHTARDEQDRIRPGTLQAMGENVLAAIQEYTRVLATDPAAPQAGVASGSVFFDVLARAMVVYPHSLAILLHNAPLAVLLALPLLASLLGGGKAGAPAACSAGALLRGACLTGASLVLALLFPALIGGGRALLSGNIFVWYGRPALAYAIYLPAAAAGLLLPYALLPAPAAGGPLSPAVRGRSLGSALFFALFASLLTSIGMHSAFLFVLWAAAALVAALFGSLTGPGSGWTSVAAALLPLVVPIGVGLPTVVSLMAHVMEKVGLGGAAPGILGLVVVDAALGVVAGFSTYLFAGTATALAASALGRRRARALVLLLLAVSVAAAAWGSTAFPQPYSYDHPKRLLAQHVVHHSGNLPGNTGSGSSVGGGILGQPYWSIAGLDSYPLERALPQEVLQLPEVDYHAEDWEALYPLNYLVTGISRAAPVADLLSGDQLPSLRETSPRSPVAAPPGSSGGSWERVHLRLDTVLPAWGVLNISAPVGAWSLSKVVGSTPTPGGSTAHMVRYASNLHARDWDFWQDVPQGAPVDIQLFVQFLHETAATRELAAKLPDWTSPAVITVYQSRWRF